MLSPETEADILASRLAAEAIPFSDETVKITARERRAANIRKIEICKALLDIIDEDDVDRYFLEMLTLAEKLEYRLQGKPATLLAQIEREFDPQPVRHVR